MKSNTGLGEHNNRPSDQGAHGEQPKPAHSPATIASFYFEEIAPRYGEPIGYHDSELNALARAIGNRLPAVLRSYLAFAGHHSRHWESRRRALVHRRLERIRHSFAEARVFAAQLGYLESAAYHETPDPGILLSYQQLCGHGRRRTAELLERDAAGADVGRFPPELLLLAEWIGGYYHARAFTYLPVQHDDPQVYVVRKQFGNPAWAGPFRYGPLSEFLMNKLRGAGEHPLRGLVIGAAGVSPVTMAAIETKGGIIGSGELWQHEQIVVVPRRTYDREYLKATVAIGRQHGFVCRYMSEVDWSLGFEVQGDYPHYVEGDQRVREHDGLRYVSSLGVRWPAVD